MCADFGVNEFFPAVRFEDVFLDVGPLLRHGGPGDAGEVGIGNMIPWRLRDWLTRGCLNIGSGNDGRR